jgi:hypothetical protein
MAKRRGVESAIVRALAQEKKRHKDKVLAILRTLKSSDIDGFWYIVLDFLPLCKINRDYFMQYNLVCEVGAICILEKEYIPSEENRLRILHVLIEYVQKNY